MLSPAPAIKDIQKNPILQIIESKVFMSPMAGVTDLPFRIILQKQGCRFAFTEMIDVNGLFYNNLKTFKMLTRTHDTITTAAQIAGSDEEKILNAAKVCEEYGYSLLELNAGCPVKKVIKDGKGSALLKSPKKLGKIVAQLVKGLKIPVTVKIRSGWDDKNLNYIETTKIIEESGASGICVHPRTRTQMYKGTPNHKITREIKETVKIPVFASGNAFNSEAVRSIFNETNCDAVALARGTLGKPWIFRQIYADLEGTSKNTEPTFVELKNIVSEHAALCLEFYGETKAFHIMYKHMQWYFKHYTNRIATMQKYREIKTMEKFMNFMEALQLDEQGRLYFESPSVTISKQDYQTV